MPNATWLAEVLRAAGLKVAEVDGWKSRGHSDLGVVKGVMCFTGDTLILARRGFIPIKDIVEDDEVWTHRNRWRRVTATGSRPAALHCLRGQGHPGILTTAEHPFLAYERTSNRSGGEPRRQLALAVGGSEIIEDEASHPMPLNEDGWIPARHMMGRLWCSPSDFGDAEPVPEIDLIGAERSVKLSRELMWVLGYWIGNGSSAGNKRHANVVLYCPLHRADIVEDMVRAALPACSRRPGNSEKLEVISFSSKPLVRWFEAHFGKLASGKKLPPWALGMRRDWREALLDGYLAADGGKIALTEGRADRVDAVTVSRQLAYGVKMLAQSLGYSTCVYLRTPPSTKDFYGRVANQLPWWTIRLTKTVTKQAHGRFHDGFFVSPCRESEALLTIADVFNITVEEDHSYVADSLVVHNCHHTASKASGNYPSLATVRDGRADLRGPLSQLGVGRDGTFYTIASGLCYHAGRGSWQGLTAGNSQFIGIEAENDGVGELWPEVQMDAYARGCAAILGHIGAEPIMCAGHKEFALPKGRKIDPSFDMPAFRARIAAIRNGGIVRPPIPKADAQKRPTLRRGAKGDDVAALQKALGLKVDALYGPATEAAVRAFQRTHGLVADGIFGPAGWAALDSLKAAA